MPSPQSLKLELTSSLLMNLELYIDIGVHPYVLVVNFMTVTPVTGDESVI